MTNTLIVIGAGSDPEPYFDENYSRIVLIEPLPSAAEALRRKSVGRKNVQIEELAVVTDPSLNQLFEFSLPEYSSVRQPSGLKSIMVGLRQKYEHVIKTLAVDELVDRYQLGSEGKNKLVIQANGEEVNIFRQLCEIKHQNRFSEIVLVGRADYSLYQNERLFVEGAGEVSISDYDVEISEGSAPGSKIWVFLLNPYKRLVGDLKNRVSDLENEKKIVETDFEQYKKSSCADIYALEKEVSEYSDKVERAEAEREELVAEVECLEEKLSLQSDTNKLLQSDIEKFKEVQVDLVEKHRHEINDLAMRAETAERACVDLESKVLSLIDQKTKGEEAFQHAERSLKDCEEKLRSLSEYSETLKDRLSNSERTNGVQAKLLTKMRADHSELSQRYSALQTRERELTELIMELHQKLTQASGFLKRLQKDHPNLLSEY
ncbi:hypothetical protein [Marinimicrobium alkaliphilum]|uniref:hypothetical protein n=1 Tax=Marinimicrobium alkaliphilum TaxID=2202654 RepID=UPI000DBA99A7|nr:hypothetical protein [Marinimicrobium alkaliphilum]